MIYFLTIILMFQIFLQAVLMTHRDPHGRMNRWNDYVQEMNLIIALLIVACMMMVHISNNVYLIGNFYGHGL